MSDDGPHDPDPYPFPGRAGSDRDRLLFELAFTSGVSFAVTDRKYYGPEFDAERDRVINMVHESFPDGPRTTPRSDG